MKLLMFSTDMRLLEAHSETRERITGFGAAADEVHIVLLAGHGPERETLAENVFLYPTNAASRFAGFFAAYQIGKKILEEEGLWLISCQDPFETGFLGYLLKVARGVPLELQVHTDFLNPYFARESAKQRIRVLIAKFLLPRADSIRAVSERIRHSIAKWKPVLAGRIGVLPVFVDIERVVSRVSKENFRERYRGYDTIVLMMSRLSAEKNIGLALTAMRDVVAQHPKTLLLIVGEGSERENIQLLITNYQLQKNVIIESWTDNPLPYYRSADMFLSTSNYEGYGRTMVEAMASGLPVVTTDVGIAGELVWDHESGRVVPVGDARAASRAIVDLIEHSDIRKKYGAAAERAIASLPSRSDYFEKMRARFDAVRPKLCYVLPQYEKGDATHFAYLIDFVKALAKSYDISLVIERGKAPEEDIGVTAISVLRARFLIGRFCELWYRSIVLRLAGYRTWYVHYSFRAAFTGTCAGAKVFYWNCGEPWKYERNFFRDAFERFTYRRVHRLVTGTEGMKRAYAEHYALPLRKIEVMPNWIHLGNGKWGMVNGKKESFRKQLGIASDQKILLFVHRLSERKGAHHLPEILAKLEDKRAVLLIAGDGPEQERINLQLTTYNLQQRVRFLGAVPHSQLPNYYALADVFLMPSDEEGFPHVLLEAMAAGVPFVASDVGGVKEIVPQERYTDVVPAGDIPAFVRRIDALLRLDPREREHVRALLQTWVSRYSIENALHVFLNFLPC